MRWLNLEPIKEWSKSERGKQISSANTYIWTLERWCWWTYLQGSSRYRGQTYGHSRGRESGTHWNSGMDTYTLPYVKSIASGNLLYDAGTSAQLMQGAQPPPRGVGWGGRWEWDSRGKGHMYTYDWFMLMYGRNQYNVIKQLPSN